MNILDNNSPPPHPGKILREECLTPRRITVKALALRAGLHRPRLSDIIHGKMHITVMTALRLARVLGTRPEFWLNLQQNWDLWEAAHSREGQAIAKLEPIGTRSRRGRS